jgi:hypothetical protein
MTGQTTTIRLIGTTKVAVVDAEDEDYLLMWTWRLHAQGYACRYESEQGRTCVILMHRVIINAPKGSDVDHVDHDVLNNSRSNLRIVSRSLNLATGRIFSTNTSGVRGVSPSRSRWKAAYKLDRQRIHVGTFATVQDAAAALDRARQTAGLPPARRREDAPLPEATWRYLRAAAEGRSA